MDDGRGRLARQPGFAAFFLQSARNFRRSLPCSPLALASAEHSLDTAFVSEAAAGAAADGAGAAGVVGGAGVWASAIAEPSARSVADKLIVRKSVIGSLLGSRGLTLRRNLAVRGFSSKDNRLQGLVRTAVGAVMPLSAARSDARPVPRACRTAAP